MVARSLLSFAAVIVLAVSQTEASVTVVYSGSGATAGLSATAVYSLVNGGSTLNVTVTNTSTAPPAGAAMVLSSINFDAGTTIIGGSAVLNSNLPSNVVINNKGTWIVDNAFAGNLDDEYGYSNGGIGNSVGGSTLVSGITSAQIGSMLNSAVTSHSNAGQHVTTFSGVQGGVGGGLDFGLVSVNSTGFGKKNFILNSMDIQLNLSAPLSDLSFLQQGSYVEFGSDYAYIGNEDPTVPEPASAAVWLGLASMLGGCAWVVRRSRE